MWGGGGQRLRLYKSQMLTGCGDKLITDDLVSSVLQHNRPLSVKTSASSIVLVLQTHESVFNDCPCVAPTPAQGWYLGDDEFIEQFCLINKTCPDSWMGFCRNLFDVVQDYCGCRTPAPHPH